MTNAIRRGVAHLSTRAADFAAHPTVQLAVLVCCALWLILGKSEDALASALTIGGFVLTQMVLNEQRRREKALHLKIDEMLLAMHGTRNELAGAEQIAEEEIERLREERVDEQP